MPVAPLPFLFLQMEQLQKPRQGGHDQVGFSRASLQSSLYLDKGLAHETKAAENLPAKTTN